MIAATAAPPLISPRTDPMGRLLPRLMPTTIMVLGFTAFTPFPGISIGSTSALQIGNILSLLLLIPVLLMPWRYRPVYLYPLLLAPLVLSTVKASLTQADNIDVCLKTIMLYAIATSTMLVTQMYAPRYALQLLTGIAAMTLVHVFIGFWQIYSFSHGEFPFAQLYVNQQFGGVQAQQEIFAKYIQRPFGLFSEPSAMSSSLAPWVVFWIAELCGVVRLRDRPARWQRILFAAAAIGGLSLIILSASGHAAITLAGVLFIGLLWLGRLRATPRSLGIALPILGVLLPLMLWMAITTMTNRVEGEYQASGSWDERSTSMVVGFSVYAHGDLPTLLFGLGAGLSPAAVWNAGSVIAVFSVSLTYLYETGLMGAVAVGLTGLYLLRVWRASGLNPAFAAFTIVWLVGITLTTSFEQLLPIWVALGWLTVWPAICTPAERAPLRRRTIELPRPDLSLQPRRSTWTRSVS
jgi:hypothetical protein